MQKTDDYWIRDLKLASVGRRDIEAINQNLPGLQALADDQAAKAPLKSAKIAGCMHITPQVACFIETLKGLGAEIQWTSDKCLHTQDAVAAALVENFSAGIFAWKDQTYKEYFECLKCVLVFPDKKGPDLIVDSQGTLSEFIHIGVDFETFFEQNKRAPELSDLGYIKKKSWVNIMTQKKNTRVQEFDYYTMMKEFFTEQNQKDPKFFRTITQNILACTDDSLVAKNLYKKISPQKLRFTPMSLSNEFSTASGSFDQHLASMIPISISNLSEISLSGRTVVQLGFSGIGKEAAQAFRDIGGAKVIICESDSKLALKASLHGYELKDLDEALQEADFLAIVNKTKISPSHVTKLKNGCVICLLDQETEIDINTISQMQDIKIDFIKPQVIKFTLREGNNFKVLGGGLPLHFQCCVVQAPQVFQSTLLTCLALALIYLWTSKGQYQRNFMSVPKFLYDQATDYQVYSADIKLSKDETGSPLSPLFSQAQKSVLLPPAQPWKGSYVAEKSELEKLKQELASKEKKVKKIENYFVSEDPIQDLNFTVDVSNDYLTQVQGTLNAYKDLLEELRKIRLDQADLYLLFDHLKEILKIQYKTIKDIGIIEFLNEAKKILKDLQDKVAEVRPNDRQTVHFQFILFYLETMKELEKIKDKSVANFRDKQWSLVMLLPYNINQRYKTQEVQISDIENYTNTCLLEINNFIQVQNNILLKLEISKEHCLLKQYKDICIILDEIIPQILQITGNSPQEGVDYEKDYTELRQKFEYLDFYTDSLIDPVWFQTMLRSYDILKKLFFNSLDFNTVLEDVNTQVEDLKSQMFEGQSELERLKNLEWSLHRIELKPANVKIQGVAVCSGIDNDKAPSIVQITPEIVDGYSQTLNKIIRGQQKNIEFMGGNVEDILSKIPPEETASSIKLPAQFKACLDLNKEQDKLLDTLQKESQTTLCLLTNEPNLRHNLFELEFDKRDLIKKLKDDKQKELDATNDRLMQLQDEYDQAKDEKDQINKRFTEANENILKLNEIMQGKDNDQEDRQKEIDDLKKQINDLQDQFKQYKIQLLADMNRLLNEIKKISVPLEAESDVQNAIIQRLAQVEDKEDLAQQIKAAQNAALDSLNIIHAKEKHLLKDSKQTLETLIGKEVPKDQKLFQLENQKIKQGQDLHNQIKELTDQNDKLKQENQQLQDKIKQLEDELKTLQDDNDKMKKLIDEQQDKCKTLEDDNNQNDEEVKNLKIENDKLNEQILGLKKELEDLMYFFQQMQDKVKDTEQQYSKYMVMSSELEKDQQINKDKLDAMLKELIKKFKEVQDLETRLSDEQMKFQRFKTEKQNRICDLEAELHRLKKIIQELEEKIQEQEKENLQLKEENVKLQADHELDQDEIERLRKLVKNLEEEINSEKNKEMRKQLLKLSEDNKQLQAKITDHQKNLEKVSRLQQQVEKLECQNGVLKEELEKIRPLSDQCIKVKHELENLKAKVAGDPRFSQIQESVEDEKTKQQLKESEEKRKFLQQSVDQLAQENDALNKMNLEYEEDIQKLKSQSSDLQSLKEMEERAQKFQEEAQNLKQQLETAVQDKNLREVLDKMQKENDELQKMVEDRQYWLGESERLKTLLDQNKEKIEDYDNIHQGRMQAEANLRKANLKIKQLEEELETYKGGEKPFEGVQFVLGEFETISGDIQQELLKQKQIVIRENILIKRISQVKEEKPMAFANVWRLFETVMDKKFEQDNLDMQAQIQPRSMQQFLSDFLIQQYEVKTTANKVLAQLMLALELLYNQKHEYGSLFCRLLQIYHPDPIDRIMMAFLTRIRVTYNKIQDVYYRRKASFEAKGRSTESKSTLPGKESTEFQECGGWVPLIDVFDVIIQIFKVDRSIGGNIMTKLLPEQSSRNDFTLFMVCWKMAKLGKQPKDVFNMIDQSGAGTISTTEFISGMQNYLDIWLNSAEIENLLAYIDSDNNGDISYSEFVDKIGFLTQKYRNKEIWMCSKSAFLTAIADEYETKRIRDYEQLKIMFNEADEDRSGTLELREFRNLCMRADPNIKEAKVMTIFNKALERTQGQNPDVMSAEAFSITALQQGLGSFGCQVFDAQKIIIQTVKEEERKTQTSSVRTVKTFTKSQTMKMT